MARLFTGGAELQDTVSSFTSDGLVSGSTCTISTSTFRSGLAAWSCNSGASNLTAFIQIGSGTAFAFNTSYFGRGYIQFTDLPTSTVLVAEDSGGKFGVKLTSGGKFQLFNLVSATQVGSDSSVTVTAGDGHWYRIELKMVNGASATTSFECVIDGVTLATSGTVSLAITATGFLYGWCEAPGASKQCYVDDLAVNDSTGANQTTYAGDGKVVLLVPTSDNARGTGWVNDANGATNFFQATDNKPPNGIADTTSSTGLHQIRNGTSNANSNYDANMTTYTVAGVGASDTINLVVPITMTAAPVATSAKQGTVGVVSNPTIANVALAAGGTSGAFWSGTAGGTYGTGWKYSPGTTTYLPSVTKGTAPVMRITQVTSSTRIAVVCFMGIVVDYTPGAAAFVPRNPGVNFQNPGVL